MATSAKYIVIYSSLHQGLEQQSSTIAMTQLVLIVLKDCRYDTIILVVLAGGGIGTIIVVLQTIAIHHCIRIVSIVTAVSTGGQQYQYIADIATIAIAILLPMYCKQYYSILQQQYWQYYIVHHCCFLSLVYIVHQA